MADNYLRVIQLVKTGPTGPHEARYANIVIVYYGQFTYCLYL